MKLTNKRMLQQFYREKGLLGTEANRERDACGVGFIYSTTGPSIDVVRSALTGLGNISHRGVIFDDEKTGDGAGIRLQLPKSFPSFIADRVTAEGLAVTQSFGNEVQKNDVSVGQFFFDQQDHAKERRLKQIAEEEVKEYLRNNGFAENAFLWRKVPVDTNYLGFHALHNQPVFEQLLFPKRRTNQKSELDLYILRQLIEHNWQKAGFNLKASSDAYICSLSGNSIVYKGMSLAHNVSKLYPDLTHPVWANIDWALIHQRMSTNTTSTADKAHPYRLIAHNGEINTLRGNIISSLSRMPELISRVATPEQASIIRNVIQRGGSDTATFDNMVELLVRGGMTLPTAISVMIPSAYGIDPANHKTIITAARDISVPWDGPVAMIGIDENHITVVRDRNGLRPFRVLETKSGLIIGGSEMGMVPVAPGNIARTIALGPGEKIAIDLKTRTLMEPKQVEAFAARELQPISEKFTARESGFSFTSSSPPLRSYSDEERRPLYVRQALANYTEEALERILDPMVKDGKEATWSMGDDTALAVFSKNRALDFFYSMIRQEFAQVTNPPVDSINERGGMVTIDANGKQSLNMPIGDLCASLPSPLLWSSELAGIGKEHADRFARFSATYDVRQGPNALKCALRKLRKSIVRQVRGGRTQIVLTHETDDPDNLPIPMPLAVSAVHSHLSQRWLRSSTAIHAHTQELIDTHKLSMLVASGANFVTPYLLEETIAQRLRDGRYGKMLHAEVFENFRKAANEGFLKIIAKMGISVSASYVGGYNYSLLGLSEKDTREFFPWTVSPIGGLDLAQIQSRQWQHAQTARKVVEQADTSGDYRLVRGTTMRFLRSMDDLDEELNEMHIWTPQVVQALHEASIKNDSGAYDRLVELQKGRRGNPIALRDRMDIKFDVKGQIGLDDVEPLENILDRFCAGGISLGAFSPWVHRDVALAMNNMRRQSQTGEGPKSSSGEGGENVMERHFQDASTRIKQIASGRFGVDALYLRDAGVIEIKVAQGAKPGEGGQLPGLKVEGLVARLRHATPGVSLISPPPHHDIYSIEDLTQLIYDLKMLNPDAKVRVKLVSQPGIGQIAVGVAKARADEIVIAGHSGGTGASPLSSIKSAGCPVEIGLAEVHQALRTNDLRDHVRLIADGSVIIGSDAVKLMMLGADEVGIGTANAVSLGCVMTHKCHLNVCPAGVATQRPELEAYYHGKPEYIENYFKLMARDVRHTLAKLGIAGVADIVGRVDLLSEVSSRPDEPKLDLQRLLAMPEEQRGHASGSTLGQGERNEPPKTLDQTTLNAPDIVRRLANRTHVERADIEINNTNLAVGAHIAGLIAFEFILAKIDAARAALPRNERGDIDPAVLKEAIQRFQVKWPDPDALQASFNGTAGQSFGAFMVPGMKFVLNGAANDYVGKSMLGGKIVIRPDATSEMAKAPDMHEIAGNTLCYGAIGGEVYLAGRARERFLVRASGIRAVAEGCGDNGCEYMSGGVAVLLGKTGKFFGSGMKGGLAFIYDEDDTAESRVNKDDIELFPFDDQESISKIGAYEDELKQLIVNHHAETGSPKAARILANWDEEKLQFKVLVPKEILALVEKSGSNVLRPTEAFFHGRPMAITSGSIT